MEILGQSPKALRDRWRIGYVPQRRILDLDVPATVAEVVTSGRTARWGWWRLPGKADRLAVDHALQAVALGDLRHRRLGELYEQAAPACVSSPRRWRPRPDFAGARRADHRHRRRLAAPVP